MALQDHLRTTLLVDGVRQVKVSEVSVTFNSGAQRVDTMDGFAGKTPGSGDVEITAKWALPITGMEFDVLTAAADGTYHELQIPVGSKTVVAQGYFEVAGFSGSTNANTEATATFRGEIAAPQ